LKIKNEHRGFATIEQNKKITASGGKRTGFAVLFYIMSLWFSQGLKQVEKTIMAHYVKIALVKFEQKSQDSGGTILTLRSKPILLLF